MTARPIQMMIAGAQKAGTSSLVRYLGQHPQVCSFPHREFSYFVNDGEYVKGYEQIFHTYFGNRCSAGMAIVAKSVGIMYLPEAVHRLYAHNPDVDLVFLLRNPVDRAYSAYWYARRMGWEPLDSFEEALKAGTERFQGNWLQERGCMYHQRGKYAEYLPLFFEMFGREQIHIYLLEDLKADTKGLCRHLYQVLGIDPSFTPDVTRRHNRAAAARSQWLARLMASDSGMRSGLRRLLPRRVRYRVRHVARRLNERVLSPPPMDPETRMDLIDYFRPFNAQLGELLHRDLSHWDEPF
jgi:hypothetical protein